MGAAGRSALPSVFIRRNDVVTELISYWLASRSPSPEILKPVGRQRRIDRRARNRPMPQPSLNRPGVVAFIGEGITAGVAEHVRVRFQFEAEPSASGPLYHPRKAGSGERRTALAHEDEG